MGPENLKKLEHFKIIIIWMTLLVRKSRYNYNLRNINLAESFPKASKNGRLEANIAL